MQQKMGKDRWNVEEESFDQNQEMVKSDTSINIPYLFRYKEKTIKAGSTLILFVEQWSLEHLDLENLWSDQSCDSTDDRQRFLPLYL
jgi:hypothetical protein